MKNNLKKIISVFLAIATIFSLMGAFSFSAFAEDYAVSKNALSYNFPMFPNAIHPSYLKANNDGTISLADVANKFVNIETRNEATFALISEKHIAFELELFGGMLFGEKYNYIAFGQETPEENDATEVIRIVKYDKSFNRISQFSITCGECFTVLPFWSTDSEMEESGNRLIFHTARKRKVVDGINHQSNITIELNTDTMTLVYMVDFYPMNHVSHSFGQFALFDGDSPVFLDHGDGAPRSIVLNKETERRNLTYDKEVYYDGQKQYRYTFYTPGGQQGYTGFWEYRGQTCVETFYTKVNMFKFNGNYGDNYTGASVGGFEMSATSYITAFNSVNQNDLYGSNRTQRNIIVSSVPKSTLEDEAVKQTTIAEYIGSDKIGSIPKLVKINYNSLVVMWQEFDAVSHERGLIKYAYIDGNGDVVGEIHSIEGVLSSCQPIVSINDNIVWFSNDTKTGERTFYFIGTRPLKGTAVIEGNACVGNTIKASFLEKLPQTELSYQWYLDGEAIAGATTREYTITKDDVGKQVECRIAAGKYYTGDVKTTSYVCVDNIYVENAAADIKIFFNNYQLDTNAILCANPINDEELKNTIIAYSGGVYTIPYIYDVYTTLNDTKVLPTEKITMLFPVPKGQDYKRMYIVRIFDDVNGDVDMDYLEYDVEKIGENEYFVVQAMPGDIFALLKPNLKKGDVNLSGGYPDLADAMTTFQFVAKKRTVEPGSQAFKLADIDGNGIIELSDAMKIFQYVAKKRDYSDLK